MISQEIISISVELRTRLLELKCGIVSYDNQPGYVIVRFDYKATEYEIVAIPGEEMTADEPHEGAIIELDILDEIEKTLAPIGGAIVELYEL